MYKRQLVNLRQAYAPQQDDPLYQTIMDAIIRANLSEGGESLMCDALYELFADQLDQRHQEGITEGISPVSYTHLDVYKRQL